MELAGIQYMLGIESGGADALIALSLLCGGDYAIKGAEHVGSKSALRLLQYLLKGQKAVSVSWVIHVFAAHIRQYPSLQCACCSTSCKGTM